MSLVPSPAPEEGMKDREQRPRRSGKTTHLLENLLKPEGCPSRIEPRKSVCGLSKAPINLWTFNAIAANPSSDCAPHIYEQV